MVIIRQYKCGCRTCIETRQVTILPSCGPLGSTSPQFRTVQDQISYAMYLLSSFGAEDALVARRLLVDGLDELRKRAHRKEVRYYFRGE